MNNFQKCGGVLFAALMIGTVAASSFAGETKKAPETAKAASSEMVESGWKQRCLEQKTEKKQCEIFQRIDTKDTHLRVAEFALGFPHEKDLEKGTARGVIILPLGILLEPGFAMKVDAGKPVSFKPRFCTVAGCVSYVNLGKDIIDSLKKSKTVTFMFQTDNGQNVNLVMSMGGFETGLKEIQ